MSEAPPADLYDRLLNSSRRHERRGKTLPYTSANGHMYSFLTADGRVCLRLSATDRLVFRERHGGDDVVQHGRVMKEYVEIPADLLTDPDVMLPLFDAALDYVMSLRPKPTRRA